MFRALFGTGMTYFSAKLARGFGKVAVTGHQGGCCPANICAGPVEFNTLHQLADIFFAQAFAGAMFAHRRTLTANTYTFFISIICHLFLLYKNVSINSPEVNSTIDYLKGN
jgi:hypothetical protein